MRRARSQEPRRGAFRGGRVYSGGRGGSYRSGREEGRGGHRGGPRGGHRGGHHSGYGDGQQGHRNDHTGRGGSHNRSHSAQRNYQQRHGNDLLMGAYEPPPHQHGSHDRITRPIGYKKLEEMEKTMSPYDIVVTLARERSGLEQLLRGDRGKIDYGMTQMLLKVFAKMTECEDASESLTHILTMLIRYEFETRIIDFIFNGLLQESNPARRRQASVHLINVCKLLVKFLTVIPSTSRKKVMMIEVILHSVITGLGNEDEEVQLHYKQLKSMLEHLKEKETTKAVKRSTFQAKTDDLHSRAPPSDFREIPVFPQLTDIHGTVELFLRTNLINKAYQDADHYLDVQFRLLREDFIRPLREGIAEIMHHNASNDQRNKRFDNVKVYKDVKVEFMKPDQKGILHRIKFSVEGLNRIKWRNTKRLLYGNLLCLSSDYFKANVHFAVVADRKPEDLQEGYLTVQFVEDVDEDEDSDEENDDDSEDSDDELGAAARPHHRRPHLRHVRTVGIDIKKVYTMVETDAYFEAYRHVLAGLKETEQIPLERYIVRCSPDMHAPEYLRPSVAGTVVQYDFSSAVTNDVSTKKVEVLGSHQWPTAIQLGLDRTQADALKLALTSELAIIQGPPGTGKTYVGLIIMKVLLANKTAWTPRRNRVIPPVRRFGLAEEAKDKQNCPILIVCYTNHALDQFLEGISKFSSENQTIIRVGGRCNNEVTKKFSLPQIRRDRRSKKGDSNAATRRAIWDLNDSMRNIERKLQANCNRLEASLHCIQRLRELQPVMPPQLYQQFIPTFSFHQWQSSNNQTEDDVLLEWLGLTTMVEKIDFAELARQNVPPLNIEILRRFGHTEKNIGKAFNETKSVQPMQLHEWIIFQQQSLQHQNIDPQHAAGDDTNQEDDEEDNIVGEADMMQEQRLLDIDEIQSNQQRKQNNREKNKQENDREINRLMERMAAVTFQDIQGDDQNNKQDDGWQETRQDKKKKRRQIRYELGKTTTMEQWEEDSVQNIYDLSVEHRWRLYRSEVVRQQGGEIVSSAHRTKAFFYKCSNNVTQNSSKEQYQ